MKKNLFALVAVTLVLVSGGFLLLAAPQGERESGLSSPPERETLGAAMRVGEGFETALFAGGCFWSLESAFEKTYGVEEAISGFAGGTTRNPTYEDYVEGGHLEAVRVIYDPTRIGYGELLDVFWRHIDPTDDGGQFVDRGPGYRTAVFWSDQDRKREADASKAALAASGRFKKPIVTEIRKEYDFYPADEYHQDFAKNNPEHYYRYNVNSGRPEFFSKVWGTEALLDPAAPPSAKDGRAYVKPEPAALRNLLTPDAFTITQEEGTEPPYQNAFWDNHEEGIYVDVVSGEPLFSSKDKYDSQTGWPSFTRPLAPGNIVLEEDTAFGMVRTEVRSRYADSHLGHLFPDGPAPTGLRYCINSASLRFIPASALEKEGYGAFAAMFAPRTAAKP